MLHTLTAAGGDESSVTIVGVDADKFCGDFVGLDVLDDDVTWSTILGAVAA